MELQEFPSPPQFSPSPTLNSLLMKPQKINEHQALDIPNSSNPTMTESSFLLSFKNITYSVKLGQSRFPCWGSNLVSPNNKKVLLNDISGEAREGEILAILGATGSGKTTLIDAIANRIDKNSLGGSVTLNGEVLRSGLLKVISAYVMQTDHLFPMLTVEETLMFSADFRLPRSFSKAKKKERVQALIDQLGLRNAAKTIIGDEGHRGISGGERKRVSIGVDIIHGPILLFLDEPTSGLDSSSAYKVVKVLQRIAQSGSIVIMSIHQPSSKIIGLLDRLILLSEGQTVYNSSPANLPRFFNDFGHPFLESGNSAELALDFIHELEETPSGIQELVEFNKSWQASNDVSNYKPSLALKDAIKASIGRGKLVTEAIATTDLNQTSSIPSFLNPFWYELLVILKRLAINSRRTPEAFGVRLGAVIITAVILATLFWQIDDSPTGIQERLACIAIALSVILTVCINEAPEFIKERFILIRETAYNAYHCSSYAFARSIFSIPPLIIIALIFSTITFWSVGFSGGSSGFFFYFLINLATFWAGNSVVAFVSAVFPNLFLAFVMSIAISTYFLFFCGFLITRERLPVYWLWMHYMSIIKYPYEAVIQNELRESICVSRGVQIFELTPLRALPTAVKDSLLPTMGNALRMNITDTTCIATGKDVVVSQLAVNQLNKWNLLLVTIAWGFFYRFLFYLALLFGSKNRRK
ncbi:ABC transporter-like protein [Corchorus olitorius]|uniref:ABC transporter-like protein n=1 Tax=Corchorus olitorius TaxID=93759 RepID=A0A1R3K963_9ROSI|nr:ABC transporter-like protein [Corchorus olitorius]